MGLLALAMAAVLGSCAQPPEDLDEMQRLIRTLEPLHQRLGEPRAGDWLAQVDEPGQSYAEYRKAGAIRRPIGKRNVIYVQPLGELSAKNKEIIERTAAFMEIYFDSPVKLRQPMSLAKIPEFAERPQRGFGKQLRATWVMYDVLLHNLPKDAAAYLALTPRDLWSGAPDSNFVFGQADLSRRVAVWSLARNGDPEKDYTKCLRRSIKTATHETGHMFSIQHCIKWQCNMCGSMSREESDRYPIGLCPECLAKVCWACTAKPADRFERLVEICQDYGLVAEREFFQRSLAAVTAAK